MDRALEVITLLYLRGSRFLARLLQNPILHNSFISFHNFLHLYYPYCSTIYS